MGTVALILILLALGALQVATFVLVLRLFRWAGRLTTRVDDLTAKLHGLGDALNGLPVPDVQMLQRTHLRVGLVLALLRRSTKRDAATPETPAAEEPETPPAAPPAPPSQKPGRLLLRTVRAAQRARGLK